MAINKAIYHRWNGSNWDIFYFKTTADLVEDTTNKVMMTASERTAISTYLDTFNAANKLVKLSADKLIPTNLIPNLSYLPIGGGTLTGNLTVNTGQKITTPTLDVTTINPTGTAPEGSPKVLQINGTVEMNSNRITEVADPVNSKDGANKDYVDSVAAMGTRPVESVKAATSVVNQVLSGETTLDGVGVKAEDRVLVWNQTDPKKNGIYIVKTTTWSKVEADSKQGSYVFVGNGNSYNDHYFFCKSYDEATGGEWIQTGRPDTVKAAAEGGLERIGNEFNIKALGVTNAMLAGSIAWGKLASQKGSLPLYNNGWVELPYQGSPTTDHTVEQILASFENAIRLLRGTSTYMENNSETIAGAYDDIATIEDGMIYTQTGASAPTNSIFPANKNVGSLFFQTLPTA